jgi:hypothetical protein
MPFLLRVLLGPQPQAADRRLTFRPLFPDWLHEVTIERLPFAGRTLDLSVRRRDGRYTLEYRADPDVTIELAGEVLAGTTSGSRA